MAIMNNFELLNSYPVEIWNSGKVHKISDSVLHLMLGQVFLIESEPPVNCTSKIKVDTWKTNMYLPFCVKM